MKIKNSEAVGDFSVECFDFHLKKIVKKLVSAATSHFRRLATSLEGRD